MVVPTKVLDRGSTATDVKRAEKLLELSWRTLVKNPRANPRGEPPYEPPWRTAG
jgi:hypothetical protein